MLCRTRIIEPCKNAVVFDDFLVKASAGVYQYVKREFDKKRENCDVLAGSNVSRKKVLVIVKRETKHSIRVSSATPKTKVRATPCGVARRFFIGILVRSGRIGKILNQLKSNTRVNSGCAPVFSSSGIYITSFIYSFQRKTTSLSD